MTRRSALDDAAVQERLQSLEGWRHEDDRLKRSFTFADFREAVAFIVRLGFEAEALDHHPELFNVYNRVDVALQTHDAGGKVTEMDFDLARAIDRAARA